MVSSTTLTGGQVAAVGRAGGNDLLAQLRRQLVQLLERKPLKIAGDFILSSILAINLQGVKAEG